MHAHPCIHTPPHMKYWKWLMLRGIHSWAQRCATNLLQESGGSHFCHIPHVFSRGCRQITQIMTYRERCLFNPNPEEVRTRGKKLFISFLVEFEVATPPSPSPAHEHIQTYCANTESRAHVKTRGSRVSWGSRCRPAAGGGGGGCCSSSQMPRTSSLSPTSSSGGTTESPEV